MGRPTETAIQSDPSGPTITDTHYDGLGAILNVSNPYRGSTSDFTTFAYDGLGRMVSRVNPDGTTATRSYSGNCVTATDENGSQRKTCADALGHITSAFEPNGVSQTASLETDYTYDVSGNLLTVNQKGGSGVTPVQRTFAYDALGRLIAEKNPEEANLLHGPQLSTSDCPIVSGGGWTKCFTYDNVGNVLSRIDNRKIVTSFCPYDALNRAVCKSYSDGTLGVTYGYDVSSFTGNQLTNGRLTSVATSYNGSIVTRLYPWSYDSMGRILGEGLVQLQDATHWFPGRNLIYTYDLAGNIASVNNGFGTSSSTASPGITISYQRNAAAQINNVYALAGAWGIDHPVSLFVADCTAATPPAPGCNINGASSYDAFGLAHANLDIDQSTGKPAMTIARTHDNRGRLKGETDTDAASGTASYYYSNTFDAAGDVLSSDDSINGTWSFTYDTLERLSTGQVSGGQLNGRFYCWQYDPFGNRGFEDETLSANTCGQAKTPIKYVNNQAQSGITYDDAGNVSSDGVNSYLYDAEGRLCAVKTAAGSFQYIYDGMGQRVAEGTISSFSCDISTNGFSTSRAMLRDLGGKTITSLSASGGQLTWDHTNVFRDSSLLATYKGNDMFFSLSDWLGTKKLQFTLEDTQTLFSTLPYGNSSGANSYIDPGASSELFTGKERDSESGNDYFGARYYGSSMGRFMSPDPSGLAFANPGNPQSLNLYSYALNNPLINIDPTGMECVWDDGSYDSADDPQTGNAAGCSGQGGTYVNPDLFENALLTNGQNANIQYGSWSGQANSTLASSWTAASGTAYGSQWAAGQEVDEALDYFYGNGAKPTLIYNNNDPFTVSFKNSLGMQGVLAGVSANCAATSGSVPVGTWEAFANTMIDGPYLKSADGSTLSGYYTPEAQMGGFNSTYSRSGGVVNIMVTNPITLNSLALHATAPLGIPNPTSGHLGTVNQQLNITAPDPCQ